MNRFTDNKYKTWLTPSLCMISISDYNTKMTLPLQVTLVSNLESYGFALVPLARACQQRAGAACGVTRSAGARADQLSLQGDQVCSVSILKKISISVTFFNLIFYSSQNGFYCFSKCIFSYFSSCFFYILTKFMFKLHILES